MTPEAYVHYRTGYASADEARWQIINSAFESIKNVSDVDLVRSELRQLLEQVKEQFRCEEDMIAGHSFAPWHSRDHQRIEQALSTLTNRMHESMSQNYKYTIRDWVRMFADHIDTYDFQAEKYHTR